MRNIIKLGALVRSAKLVHQPKINSSACIGAQRRFSTSLWKGSLVSIEIKKPSEVAKDSSGGSPLVFVFAWAGATHDNVSKYSSVYTNMGCTAVQYVLPSQFILFQPNQIPSLVRSVMETVEVTESLYNRKIFVHCLSDTGLMCYQCLTLEDTRRQTETEERKLDISGIVYDSCPGPFPEVTLYNIAKFLLINLYCCHRDKVGFSASLVSSYQLWRQRIWPNILRKRKALPVDLSNIGGVWAGHFGQEHCISFPGRRELFIYSDNDYYLDYQFIENHVLPTRKGKEEVSSWVKFTKSHHVQHLRVHKEAYRSAVVKFIQKGI